jgi:formiminotetrahydrofolate cyclodeaminase
MIQQPFDQIVASLAAKTPTPGGGAAAAMAGCMGTALFLMVVRFSRGKKANVDRDADLQTAETLLDGHVKRLLPMAERDCKSFDLVSAAYGMPKDDEAQKALREKAIQEAMVGAMVVPEETLCMVRDVFVAMQQVVGCIGKAIVSDLASGASLLLASAEGAFLNVRINAAFLTNRELADRTLARAGDVLAEIRKHQSAIAISVDKMLS